MDDGRTPPESVSPNEADDDKAAVKAGQKVTKPSTPIVVKVEADSIAEAQEAKDALDPMWGESELHNIEGAPSYLLFSFDDPEEADTFLTAVTQPTYRAEIYTE